MAHINFTDATENKHQKTKTKTHLAVLALMTNVPLVIIPFSFHYVFAMNPFRTQRTTKRINATAQGFEKKKKMFSVSACKNTYLWQKD